MKRSVMILAAIAALAAGCGNVEPAGTKQTPGTPESYGITPEDMKSIQSGQAPGVELVQQKVLTTYPSGETPYCPFYDGNYEIAPPGNIQIWDSYGICWRIYCPTGDAWPWNNPNVAGYGLPNLTQQTNSGFTWNDRITMIQQGPGTNAHLFTDAGYTSGYGTLGWTGWEWRETSINTTGWWWMNLTSSLTCSRNY